MEFWGVEVKNGASLSVDPGKDMIMHISQVALGETKNNGNESVQLYLKAGDQKLLIGTLSHGKLPQLSTELVLEKRFELSHSWKNGSVFFCGYKVDTSDPPTKSDDISDDELAVASDKEPAVAKSGVKQVNFQLPNEDVKAKQENDADSDEQSGIETDDDMSSSGDEEEKKVTAEVDSDEDEDDSSDEDDEADSSDDDDDDTPKKPEESKKRASEDMASKNPASSKKPRFVTPQKTETKKPHVHVATPHPSKQAGKNSGSNGEASKTRKSANAFGCKSCNRSFTSEMGLQSHTKAKHSAAA